MHLQHLAAYDVAAKTIEAFRDAIGDTLLPAQELAVREGLLEGDGPAGALGHPRNLVVAAPTSSGKSFLAELCGVHTAQRGGRVLYLVPLKAMAEEAFRTLVRRYARLDLKVVVSTRDRREFDAQIESGSFHIAVMVFEKLQSLLVTRPELLSQVQLVIVDELHLLLDPSRGPKLELLLTKIRRAQRCAPARTRTPRLLCLSAPLLGLEQLGAWLSAHVVRDERRPVELRAGVLFRGRFTYRSSRQETDADGPSPASAARLPSFEEEIYADEGPGDSQGRDPLRQVLRATAALSTAGEQTLIFAPDRARCVELARELCGHLIGAAAPPPATTALEEIAATDSGQAQAVLLETLQRGVAFHNADLSQGQREAIERGFRSGEIRVLCATSTLAMGVNLPARNVILAERWKWRFSRRYNKWVRDELTKAEYDGMSGRAGRLGLTGALSFGRSLLVAPSRFDAEVWLRTLVAGPPLDLQPTLLGKPLGDVVLDLVASGLCRDEAEVIDFLLSTFTGHVRWSLQPGQQAFAQGVHLTLEELRHNDLLAMDEDGGLRITAVGRVCARKGLLVRTAVLLSRWAEAAAPADVNFTALEVLLVCALTPDGGEAHVPLSLPEHRFGDYWTRMMLKAQEVGAAERRLFRWLREQRGRLTYEQTKAVKKALLLLDWVDNHDCAEIERDHAVWSGAVAHAAADFRWLVDALCELCDARGWPSERTAALLALGERLRYGVDGALLPLARATGEALSRTSLQRMAAAGVKTEAGLLAADAQTLERAVGHRSILQKIYLIQAARRAGAAPATAGTAAEAATRAAAETTAAKPAGTAQVLTLPLPGLTPVGPVGPGAPVRSAQAARALSSEALTALLEATVKETVTTAELPVLRPVVVSATPAQDDVSGGGAAAAGADGRPGQGAALELALTTEAEARRCFLRLGPQRVPVSPNSFALLARLALDADGGSRGWVRTDQLGRSQGAVRKSISRLRAELRRVNIEARSWIENDGQGQYRLSLSAPRVVFDREALRRHPLATIRNVLRAA